MKKLFFKILQYSQENTQVRVFFNKVTGLRACNFIKERLQHKDFIVNIPSRPTTLLKRDCNT